MTFAEEMRPNQRHITHSKQTMNAAITILIISIAVGAVHLSSWASSDGFPLVVSRENAVIFAIGLVIGTMLVMFSANVFFAIKNASEASSEEEFEAQVVPALDGDAVSPEVLRWFVWPIRIAIGAAIGLLVARIVLGLMTPEAKKANKASILTPDPLQVEMPDRIQPSTQKSESALGQA